MVSISGEVKTPVAHRNQSILAKSARVLNRIADISAGFIVQACLLSITILILLEALSRYVIKNMPLGIEALALTLVGWVYFTGAGIASRDKRHVTVDMLSLVTLPAGAVKYLDVISESVSVVICGIFSYWSIQYAIQIAQAHILIAPFYYSAAWKMSSLGVGLVVATLYQTVHLVRAIQRLRLPSAGRPQ